MQLEEKQANEHYLKAELYDLLKTDEATLEFLQKSSMDGLWYWDVESPDQEWMSPEFWMTLGYDPADKKHLASEWQDLIHPDDLAVAMENFKKHCEDPSHPYDQVVRYKHKNGSTVWVRCRGKAIRDGNGKAIRMLGAHNDITRQVEAEQRYKKNMDALDELYATTKLALEESEALFNLSPDAILQVDSDGFIVKANNEASRMFGYSEAELLEISVDQLIPPRYRHQHSKDMKAYHQNPSIRPMGISRKNISAITKTGNTIPVEIRLGQIKTHYGTQTIASIRDVTEQEHLINSLEQKISQNEALWQQATTDPLTKLYNRRYLEEASQREFNNTKRHNQPLSVMMLDIDNFKDVNDSYGHKAGDIVLKDLSDVIGNLIRVGDIFARIGGEEFVILLPATSELSALALAERIRYKVVHHKIKINNGLSLSISISIGVCEKNDQDKGPEDMLQRADEALYTAKKQGRNKVVQLSDARKE